VTAELKPALDQGIEWTGELKIHRSDGSYFWSFQSVTPLLDDEGKPIKFVATFEDITNLKDAQETIEQLAFYDPLTELPNRRLLADRLSQAIEHADRNPDTLVATLVFDLDNFKTVNDSLGHNLGDELLKKVAQIFSQQVRSEDTVSRQGGDEFTIVLAGMKSVGEIADIADAIIQRLKKPIELSGNQVVIGTSIGVAVYPLDAKDRDGLLHCADMAMYHAKDEGKNNFQFYTAEMNDKARNRLIMEGKLRTAIEQSQFTLFYQPQVDLKSGQLIGAEALIRWIDPDKGMISPLEFIPLAEETGLIGPLGDWVIRTACREMAIMLRGICTASLFLPRNY
jgi:diguanylate cyclase (GGDEF)-like protein